MRAKESVEIERKTQSRHVEKQAKAIERLVDSERNLTAQVGDLEKEVVQWKRRAESAEFRVEELDRENVELKHAKSFADYLKEKHKQVIQGHEKQMERKRADFWKCEEALLRYKKDAENSAAKLQSLADSTMASQKETELEHEAGRLMSLLKCSTCKMRMRNTVIMKCMHTFCKECVETRLTLRNRKCPFCSLAFAQSDVQSIFFQ
jgi:E3 ubiquitin-protein ligase BRE1